MRTRTNQTRAGRAARAAATATATTTAVVVAVVVALLLGPAPAAAAGATGPPRGAPDVTSDTASTAGCQVVAVGRAGRAWLPWARLALPGGRLVSVDVVAGVARAEQRGGTVLLQRTSRRSPGATDPVEVLALVAGPEGTAWRACTVDLNRPEPDRPLHVRRWSS